MSAIQASVPTLDAYAPIFEAVDELRALWADFEHHEVQQGDAIYLQDEDADTLFILVSGAVGLHRAHQCISMVREGDAFGGLGLVAESQRVTSAIAVDDSSYLRITTSRFEQRSAQGCPVMQRLMKHFLKRATDIVRRQNIAHIRRVITLQWVRLVELAHTAIGRCVHFESFHSSMHIHSMT